MKKPLLYEINTRCWLRELSAQGAAQITLKNVPITEFKRWQDLGFTHIWLMGIWPTGPRSRTIALEDSHLRAAYDAALPGWKAEDVAGSPYAIADYSVSKECGGAVALKVFREQLHSHGLKLILDFIPNHVGLDHPWVRERPELFVQSPKNSPGTFRLQETGSVLSLAHGRDPYFPAWTDTAQLDYRRPDTRIAMIEALKSVAAMCDGARCDMAMLQINEIFAQTWAGFPGEIPPGTEFWTEAIESVRKKHRDFLFLGEVYWDFEARLQNLGFDYTYDKRLYDAVSEHRPPEVQRQLLDAPEPRVTASAHFLENHDETRVASRLQLGVHRAAALLILGVPGMGFLHEGQLTGAVVRTPVQLCRRLPETPNPDIERLYADLLAALRESAVGKGAGKLLRPTAAWPDNPTAQNFVLVQWQDRSPDFDLVVVNLASKRGQCYAPLSIPELSTHNWALRDLLGQECYERFGNDLQTQGLYLDVPGYAAQLFHFQPIR